MTPMKTTEAQAHNAPPPSEINYDIKSRIRVDVGADEA